MESNKYVKIYALLGKILCGVAGGIVGFFIGGPLLVVPGVLLGAVFGHLMNKSILSHSL